MKGREINEYKSCVCLYTFQCQVVGWMISVLACMSQSTNALGTSTSEMSFFCNQVLFLPALQRVFLNVCFVSDIHVTLYSYCEILASYLWTGFCDGILFRMKKKLLVTLFGPILVFFKEGEYFNLNYLFDLGLGQCVSI